MNRSTQPPMPGLRKPRTMPPVWLVLAWIKHRDFIGHEERFLESL